MYSLLPIRRPRSPAPFPSTTPFRSLTVNGTNFVSTSTVNWNGSPLTTTFVSSARISTSVTSTHVGTADAASGTVVNPAPGGGTSNSVTFTINPPPPVITSATTASGT